MVFVPLETPTTASEMTQSDADSSTDPATEVSMYACMHGIDTILFSCVITIVWCIRKQLSLLNFLYVQPLSNGMTLIVIAAASAGACVILIIGECWEMIELVWL